MANELDNPDIPWYDAIGSNLPYAGIPYDIATHLLDEYGPPPKLQQGPAEVQPFYNQANPFFNLGIR